ncbi:MAG: inositol monophosphatase [Candidatus Omnitrophica bacterium]|nr:inositol monophosphatase [Candidatus Omnitrophota bacterium]
MQRADLESLLSLAQDAARNAARDILKTTEDTKAVTLDMDRDVKVEADKKLEDSIIERLKLKSGYSIISEEKGFLQGTSQEKDPRWIVDPLDGSLNFSRGIPLSCISIGLWKGMEPILGVVYDFNRGEAFSGIVGAGAWLNGEPIGVSMVVDKHKAVLCTGFPAGTDFSKDSVLKAIEDIRTFKKVRLLGSAALSLAYVSCGRADFYHENDIKIWDAAGGLALVKAAGGAIEFTPSRDELTLNVSASNPFLI